MLLKPSSLSLMTVAALGIRSSLANTRSFSQFSRFARIALCQISVGNDKPININSAMMAIDKAVNTTESRPDIVVLPEVWNSPYSTASFPVYAEPVPRLHGIPDDVESPSTAMLVNAAKRNGVWLVGGSVPEFEIDEQGVRKLFNTCVVINPDGTIVGKHRKVHLFDIDIPGKMTFKESDSLSAGDDVTVVETPWGGMGVGICYDIRFPELAMLMRQRGCRLLVYPGAFNMVTGPAHWELLQRARAVDNQLFVAACSPARNEGGGYVAWGHSSVVSPWGEVIAKAGHGDETIFAELDFSKAEEMRANIPCWQQKRNDIYQLQETNHRLE